VKSLSSLDFYHQQDNLPRLLVYVVPTDPFQNKLSLQISSEHVQQKAISVKIKEKQGSKIQKLLKDLIMIPKAQGLVDLN
jgi:hypothetical protein